MSTRQQKQIIVALSRAVALTGFLTRERRQDVRGRNVEASVLRQ